MRNDPNDFIKAYWFVIIRYIWNVKIKKNIPITSLVFGASSKISSIFLVNILSPTFGLIKSNRFPVATAISDILGFGHQATHLITSSVLIVLIQRAVAISQTEKLKQKEKIKNPKINN